jgi:PAT family beta-lactamase induction signal transducer AmpG
MLLAQGGVVTGLLMLSQLDPSADIGRVAILALVIAFSSATQDITIDAYRIEAVSQRRQGAMAASYNLGYRIAVLAGGAGALYLADFFGWGVAYAGMAGLMVLGVATALIIREPEHRRGTEVEAIEAEISRRLHLQGRGASVIDRLGRWLSGAVVAPFVEFFRRNGRFALVLLALILTFNISDRVLGIIASPRFSGSS